MKKIVFIVLVSITIFGLVGCGMVSREISREETSPEQSTFKQNYSIGPIIKANQELLLEGPLALSGSEAGPREPFIQSQEEMVVQEDSANTSPLLVAIQSETEEAIRSSGATIVGSSGRDIEPDPIAHFSYSYSEGPFYGVINIWGLQGEGNTLIILSEITESNVQKK
jgi:hypothetical protein